MAFVDAEAVNAAVEAIKPAIEKIGEGGAQFFAFAVKYSFAKGIAEILLSGLALLGIWLCFKWLYTKWKETEKEYARSYDSNPYGIGLVMLSILGGVGIIMGVLPLMFDGIVRVIAPEYTAVLDIITLIKQ